MPSGAGEPPLERKGTSRMHKRNKERSVWNELIIIDP